MSQHRECFIRCRVIVLVWHIQDDGEGYWVSYGTFLATYSWGTDEINNTGGWGKDGIQ